MYEGLYDTKKGLSAEDFELVGAMTAKLLMPWREWVHRRVDRVTFSDEDALCRDVSIDFTLPHWFHVFRGTESREPKRQLVPIGFFRKEALTNFSLTDDSYTSLPFLTAPQTSQVAEAVLLKIGELSLGKAVPTAIRHDIHGLIYEGPQIAAQIYDRLFEPTDQAWHARELLLQKPGFANTAAQFRDSFLGLTMLDIRHHERRVLHFSFEEQLEFGNYALKRAVEQAVGEPRRIAIGVMAPSSAASYHLEVEAPDGLMLKEPLGYHYVGGTVPKPVQASATLRRAHFHFTNAPAKTSAGAELSLYPRRSTVVRPATLMACLTLVATAAIGFRFPHIESGDNAAAAALLLAVTGVVGLIVARSGEGEMATSLLLPLRVLGITPAVLGVLAAVVVVIDPTDVVAYALLGVIAVLMAVSTGLLIRNWRRCSH
jgi:hypothetical protein